MTGRQEETIIYKGSSMVPTLKQFDVISIVPYGARKIIPGDVIVFPDPSRDRTIIHRVIAARIDGIRTRGDNSQYDDLWSLSPENIHGQAVVAKRGKKLYLIYGGVRGRLNIYCVRAFRVAVRILSAFLHPFYHALAKTGICYRMLPTRLRPRILSFKTDLGTELQMMMGRILIGRLKSGEKDWEIHRPYRIFVDMKHIPYHEKSLS